MTKLEYTPEMLTMEQREDLVRAFVFKVLG